MSHRTDNQNLDFLPAAGDGNFWEVKYDEKHPRTKPLKLSLREAFRPGTPVGETLGWEYAEANKKSLTNAANDILVRCADRKKFIGTFGVQTTKG